MYLALAALSSLLLPQDRGQRPEPPFTAEELGIATNKILGLDFSTEELEMMRSGVFTNLQRYQTLRQDDLDNSVLPAVAFRPIRGPRAEDFLPREAPIPLPEVERPEDLEELAFADIRVLASLIRSKKVSCVELTEMYLARLKRLDEELVAVVNFTEARARKRAQELDALLAEGTWLGPLHGIPYGAKDLLSTETTPTTWGAGPYKDQVIDADAAVVRQLDAAGAVLIAKLSLGALAMGDQWFKGRTNNPWNTQRGSSGSSAGPAAATAAGGVAFSIGSETLGSILSPSLRCGCSSLRPTFGVVSTEGSMALSWSMDKLGPLCRSLEDAALVYEAIIGEQAAAEGYRFEALAEPEVSGMRVGYLEGAFDADAKILEELGDLGVELTPVRLPEYPINAMRFVLSAEAAAAFDELTRSDRDELLRRQGAGAWPNTFRTHRLVPAVEYIRANRLRTLMMQDLEKVFADIDVLVHPTHANLAMFNLSGHPSVIGPADTSRTRNGAPPAIAFTGRLYGESKLLAVAQAWQAYTEYHRQHPK